MCFFANTARIGGPGKDAAQTPTALRIFGIFFEIALELRIPPNPRQGPESPFPGKEGFRVAFPVNP